MYSSDSESTSGDSSSDCLEDSPVDSWDARPSIAINDYPVSLRREQELCRSQAGRLAALERRREEFLEQYDFPNLEQDSIMNTPEAQQLRVWCKEASWSFCPKCGKVSPAKLLPSFRTRKPNVLDHSCKCGGPTYCVPQAEDVPLVLRNLTAQDIRVLRPLVIHSGKYKRVVHGYRQRTGPFRVSWSTMSVQDKISGLDDSRRCAKLQRAYEYLMSKRDTEYSKFVSMQLRGVREPFSHEVFTAPDFQGVECALWPTLYHSSKLCETLLEGQSNRASSKLSYMHKVLSPVVDYSMDFDLLQFTYDHWLFKTVTGAINASKASGCSPNCGLQQKSFSATFWRWQHLLLVDAVRQYGFPSFFLTISPYEWTFPWPGFIEKIREQHCLEPTDLPVLETLHVANVLEQIACGYLAGANTNRWRQHVFGNSQQPMDRNVITYFYRFEFQSRGTLHLHMLVWVKDLALIRANLLRASIPWGNAEDAFLVADTQKSSSSCLPLFDRPDCFEQQEDGSSTLRFHYGQEDSDRNLRACVTTLLGAGHVAEICLLVRHQDARGGN